MQVRNSLQMQIRRASLFFSSFFTQIVYTAVQPLQKRGRKFSEICATRWLLCHSDFSNLISAGVPLRSRGAGGAYDAPQILVIGWGRGISPPHTPPPRRLRRLAHRASPLFKTFRRPCVVCDHDRDRYTDYTSSLNCLVLHVLTNCIEWGPLVLFCTGVLGLLSDRWKGISCEYTHGVQP